LLYWSWSSLGRFTFGITTTLRAEGASLMPREGSLYGWYWYLPAEAEFAEDWFQGSLPGTTFTAEWSEPVGDWTDCCQYVAPIGLV